MSSNGAFIFLLQCSGGDVIENLMPSLKFSLLEVVHCKENLNEFMKRIVCVPLCLPFSKRACMYLHVFGYPTAMESAVSPSLVWHRRVNCMPAPG